MLFAGKSKNKKKETGRLENTYRVQRHKHYKWILMSFPAVYGLGFRACFRRTLQQLPGGCV